MHRVSADNVSRGPSFCCNVSASRSGCPTGTGVGRARAPWRNGGRLVRGPRSAISVHSDTDTRGASVYRKGGYRGASVDGLAEQLRKHHVSVTGALHVRAVVRAWAVKTYEHYTRVLMPAEPDMAPFEVAAVDACAQQIVDGRRNASAIVSQAGRADLPHGWVRSLAWRNVAPGVAHEHGMGVPTGRNPRAVEPRHSAPLQWRERALQQ